MTNSMKTLLGLFALILLVAGMGVDLESKNDVYCTKWVVVGDGDWSNWGKDYGKDWKVKSNYGVFYLG